MGRHSAPEEPQHPHPQGYAPPEPVAHDTQGLGNVYGSPRTAPDDPPYRPTGEYNPEPGYRPLSPRDDSGQRRPARPTPRPADRPRDEGDLAALLRQERQSHGVGSPRQAEPAERPHGRQMSWKYVVGAGALIAGLCGLAGPHFHETNENGRPGSDVGTRGPNQLPVSATVTGDPMGTPEQRQAAVQRAVNNGEYGKTVHTLPGDLTVKGPGGKDMHIYNPIVVTEGLPRDAASINLQSNVLGGRIFGLTPGGYDPTKGVGQSYNLVPIDPAAVTGWKGATSPEQIVNVELAWDKSQAGMGLEPQSDKPFTQTKQGVVTAPGSNNAPYYVGRVVG